MTTQEDALIQQAVDAHGGTAAWSSLEALEAEVSASGVLQALKGRRSLDSVWIRAYTRQPRLLFYDYPRSGLTAELAGEREVRIADGAGNVLATRPTPRRAFSHPRRWLYWDDLDFVYFLGTTLWNTLTLPFALLEEGFAYRLPGTEVSPRSGWSRLEVQFPSRFPAQGRTQVLAFDEQHLLRRVDYALETVGSWLRTAHFMEGYDTFAGLRLATRHTVLPFLFGEEPQRRPVLVALQVHRARPFVG